MRLGSPPQLFGFTVSFIVLGLGLEFVNKKQKTCGLGRRKACVCYRIWDL